MRATGFSGYATIMGKERKIVFDEGQITIYDIGLDEAQVLTEVLERNSDAMVRQRAAAALGQQGRVPVPSTGAAPVQTRAREREPEQPVTDPNPTGRVERAPEPEQPAPRKPTPTAPKVEKPPSPDDDADEGDDDDDVSAEDERAAIQAVEREAEEAEAKRQADEAKRQAEVDAKKKAAKAQAEERARKEAEEKAAAAKATEKKGNSQPPSSGSIDAPDDEDEPAPPKTSNGKAVPEEIRSAKHLRAVIVYCVETLKMDPKKPKPIIDWCAQHSKDIEIVSRLGDRLGERVERAIEVMAAN